MGNKILILWYEGLKFESVTWYFANLTCDHVRIGHLLYLLHVRYVTYDCMIKVTQHMFRREDSEYLIHPGKVEYSESLNWIPNY